MDLVLFLVCVLMQSHVSGRKYQKSTSDCRFWNNIYKSTKVRSKIDCSSLCSQELCSRFIYDSSTNMCNLHSDESMISDATKTPKRKSLFLSTHKDCNVSGYDFVESQKLCIKYYNNTYSYEEGRAVCQQDGGDLLTLDKIDKWNFIYQHLDSCKNERTWLGLRNRMWVNGVPFQDIYNVTTVLDSTLFEESCVRLKLRADRGVLADDNCMDAHMVICEIPIS